MMVHAYSPETYHWVATWKAGEDIAYTDTCSTMLQYDQHRVCRQEGTISTLNLLVGMGAL